MWKRHAELAKVLADDIATLGTFAALAVTMTGELADCYNSRRDGVAAIVTSVEQAASSLEITSVGFYGTDGRFHDAHQATQNWSRVAASNWHALAQWVADEVAPDGLLIDIGSTTTDIVLIRDRKIQTQARTDMERLADDSLVYVGCRRTPVCALVGSLSFRGQSIAVMNELFATIDDARLCLGQQAEDPGDRETADGKPRDRPHAVARLARMIGLDGDEVNEAEVRAWSSQIVRSATDRISAAIGRWAPGDSIPWILSGHGQDLLSISKNTPKVDLRSRWTPEVSRVAPAWAVAGLLEGIERRS
ncbi:Hydantoinase/oxoprolinase [Neorhodopirellula pilleata]|uniref:Hydantoinase/oxoprolinase n=2 Tax=Neorhodopirellula pilleata TaxID=2714738 RepID=A0A5C6ADJ5_9BACT|nr:Hydantoinase/oxoprolinase [Neorhodopirellula pilleata]